MVKDIRQEIAFVTPVYCVDNLLGAYQATAEAITQMMEAGDGVQASNVGGWHSPSFLSNPTFDALRAEITNVVRQIGELWEVKEPLHLQSMWCNANGYRDFNLPHVHPGALFSGVYYASVPQSSGNIVFIRPDTHRHYFHGKAGNNTYTFDTMEYPSIENRLYVFPAYLEHYVQPNLSKGLRLSVAFNYGTIT